MSDLPPSVPRRLIERLSPLLRAVWRQARRPIVVSVALHLALLALLVFWPRRPGPKGPPQDPGFEMVFAGGVHSAQAVPVPGKTTEVPKGSVTAPAQAGEDSHWEPQVNLFTAEEQEAMPPPPQPDEEPMPALPPPPPPTAHGRSRSRAASRTAAAASNPFTSAFMSAQSTNRLPPGAAAAQGTTLSMGEFARGGQALTATAQISIPGAHGDYDDILYQYAVDHLSYPEQAASNSESGSVVIRITVARDGTVRDVRLLKSSVYRTLDLNTMDLYRNKHFPPLPDYIDGATHDFTLEVIYELIPSYR